MPWLFRAGKICHSKPPKIKISGCLDPKGKDGEDF